MADELNFQVSAEGFGSYLDGILPSDVAVSAGAFSASMQQIRNILNVDFEKFAQVVYSTEVVNTGLNLVNGSDIPTNLSEAQQGHNIVALGSGPYGSYTASDFFGCMSGLPYMWGDIQSGVLGTQTTKLSNIYLELFLAVTWERAVVGITQSRYNVEIQPYIPPTYDPLPPYGMIDPGQPRIDDWYYTVASSLEQVGGGYGRGTAPAPTISFTPNNCGASATCTIGTDNAAAASMGGGTFGRVTSYSFNPGTAYKYTTTSVSSYSPPPPPTAPTEYVTILSAPTATLAVLSNGQRSTSGVNTAGTRRDTTGGTTVFESGWPAMNTVVQSYIDQANAEIANIRTLNPYKSKNLNTVYNAAGTQLKIEQRARFSGIAPVPIGRDDFLNQYPTALSVFVDAIPYLAQDTRPHMYAQTLEAISNVNTVGGQSIIAMARQERNAARLQEIGIELDNNIPGVIDSELEKIIIANGIVPVGVDGISIDGINGDVENPTTIYTLPSNLMRPSTDGASVVAPSPRGYYDPNTLQIKSTPNKSSAGQLSTIQQLLNLQNSATNNINLLGPSRNGTGPATPKVGQNDSQNDSFISTGSIPGANSVNPKPNQTPLNLQTGLVNTGPYLPNRLVNTGSITGVLSSQPLAPLNLQTGLVNTGPYLPNGRLVNTGSITGVLSSQPLAPLNLQTGSVNTGSITGVLSSQPLETIAVVSAGPILPIGLGTPIDTGKSTVPGSLAGSNATNLIPPNLNSAYTSSTLTPSTLSVQEAIEDVILCNCDCWVD